MSVTHIVLFRPRVSLTADARTALVRAIESAATQIPGVRRFRVGRQMEDAPSYRVGSSRDFPFCALVEFDDLTGLETYLAHHHHQRLGAMFNETLEAAFIADYEVVEGSQASALDTPP